MIEFDSRIVAKKCAKGATGVGTATLAALLICGFASSSIAATPEATVAALRISGIVTGGTMPTNSPEFQSMATAIESNDHYGAALTAIQSRWGANYLLRRLALQMQNPELDATSVNDSSASAFLLAHFAGVNGVDPSISKIWSNNMTCLVRVTRNNQQVMVRANQLTAAEKLNMDWKNSLVCSPGQEAINGSVNFNRNNPARVTIPEKHVGGYVTLSDGPADTSFAEFGATAGTNLRFIAGIWTISTGLDIISFASSQGRLQTVPRFVPENDPNFLIGQGQTACINCHAGGIVSLNHGYSTVADQFDFDPNAGGFRYIVTPNTNSRKSLGSMQNQRQATLTCNLQQFTVCAPDSLGADPNQSWDLGSTWGARGLLTTLGWSGPFSGQGLNTLGQAIGKASIVYTNLVKRVIREVCPLGAVPSKDVASIAQIGQTTDDIKQVIAHVASNPACR